MKLLRNYKLKGGSLVESVIAISIVSICLTMVSLVYSKLLDSDYDMAYFKAKQQVHHLHLQMIREHDFNDDFYNYNSYKIEKLVQDVTPGVKEIQFTIKTKKITEHMVYWVMIESKYEEVL